MCPSVLIKSLNVIFMIKLLPTHESYHNFILINVIDDDLNFKMKSMF